MCWRGFFQERQADEENCFALVPSVEKPETHCFPKSQFSIALSDEGEWQITINPGDASDRFFWGNDSDEIFSKDPDIWSGFMDEHWPQATEYVGLYENSTKLLKSLGHRICFASLVNINARTLFWL